MVRNSVIALLGTALAFGVAAKAPASKHASWSTVRIIAKVNVVSEPCHFTNPLACPLRATAKAQVPLAPTQQRPEAG